MYRSHLRREAVPRRCRENDSLHGLTVLPLVWLETRNLVDVSRGKNDSLLKEAQAVAVNHPAFVGEVTFRRVSGSLE